MLQSLHPRYHCCCLPAIISGQWNVFRAISMEFCAIDTRNSWQQGTRLSPWKSWITHSSSSTLFASLLRDATANSISPRTFILCHKLASVVQSSLKYFFTTRVHATLPPLRFCASLSQSFDAFLPRVFSWLRCLDVSKSLVHISEPFLQTNYTCINTFLLPLLSLSFLFLIILYVYAASFFFLNDFTACWPVCEIRRVVHL